MHLELDKEKLADSEATLVPDLQKAWLHFLAQLLENLISVRSESMRKCALIRNKHIYK